MTKRIATLVLAIGLAIGIGNGTVQAAQTNGNVVQDVMADRIDRAGASDINTATPYTLGSTLNKEITQSDPQHFYKFNIPNSGRIKLNMTSYMEYYTIQIYNSDTDSIWYTDNNTLNSSLQVRKDTYEIDLAKGNYYIRVTGYRYKDNTYPSSTGNYSLQVSFTDSKENISEPNNDFDAATPLNTTSNVNGQIAINDRLDIYKINLPTSGRIKFDMTSYMEYYTLVIYDSDTGLIWYTDNNELNSSLQLRKDTHEIDLIKGSYYIQVTGYKYKDNTYPSSTGNYSLQTSFTDAKENTVEPNNDFTTAHAINFNSAINGQIAINDNYDIFKFSLSSATDVKLDFTSYMMYYTVIVYDNAGKEVWYKDKNKWNENVKYTTDTHKIPLQAGTYYLKVSGNRYHSSTYDSQTGNYTFSLSTFVSLANATVSSIKDVTYTGKPVQPKVTVKYNGNTLQKDVDYTLKYENNTSIGKAGVTITGIGNYTGIKTVNFNIVPKKVKIKSAKNRAKKTALVTWQADRTVTGYEIYRSTKKNSGYKKVKTIKKNNTTTYKNAKLKKKKTYYYKIRSYKVVDGKKFYGEFSKTKSVKIKK